MFRQFTQPADGVGDALVLVSPFVGVVLLHVGGQHEDVLVHEYLAEAGGGDRAANRLDLPVLRHRWAPSHKGESFSPPGGVSTAPAPMLQGTH